MLTLQTHWVNFGLKAAYLLFLFLQVRENP